MPINTIELAGKFVPILDDTYAAASLTADLDGSPELVREGANANELIVPMLDMQGLGDYDKDDGYANGAVKLKNQTIAADFDRGRMFSVDSVDEEEALGVAFGNLAGEFIRTKVVPEEDAVRFAKYSSAAKNKAVGTLTTGADWVAAIRAGQTAMDDAGVPMEERYLFITPTGHGLITDMDTNKSRAIISEFAKIVKVPKNRFYTAIEQLDGVTDGEKEGGYKVYAKHYAKCASTDTGAMKVVATGAADGQINVADVTPLVDASYTPVANDYVCAVEGKELNFVIIQKRAVCQFAKHKKPKIVDPSVNQSADAWKFGYRQVGVNSVYANKTAGVYAHSKA